MRTTHLSENEIQDYVLDLSACSPERRLHIGQCESCKQNIRLYRALFEGIAYQTKPVFEFDLPDLVMTQLLEVKKKPVRFDLFVCGISLMSLIFVGSVIFLFKPELMDLLVSMTSIVFYLAGTILGSIFLSAAFDMNRKFKSGLRMLEFR